MPRDLAASLRRVKWKSMATSGMQIGLVLTSAMMLWKLLVLASWCDIPIAVTASPFMFGWEYHRGDLLLLSNHSKVINDGELVAFNKPGGDVIIVHRAIKVHDNSSAPADILTKGDNNHGDDRGLYSSGQQYILGNRVIGRVLGYIPWVGLPALILHDAPLLRWLLVIGMLFWMTRWRQASGQWMQQAMLTLLLGFYCFGCHVLVVG